MNTPQFPQQAAYEAKHLTLSDAIWNRPRVQGFTIDGPTSRDLDDAIWIEPTDDGAILSVHIADVSELVTPGSMLDKVAIARTQTRYFGNGNDPMLPRILSENRLSLLEYQDRPTLTVKVELDADANTKRVEIFESWMASTKKFSYAEADAALDDPNSPFQDMLHQCHQWANKLNQKRASTGAIGGIATPTGEWLDENGAFLTANEGKYNCHVLIQEFMILANIVVAEWMAERDTPALYRNHTARAIAPDRDGMYQVFLTLGSGAAIRQRLKSWLNRAEYGPTLIGHFALNLPAYCHFTSPIRRLADLINHRIVKALLHEKENPYSKADLEQLGKHIHNVTLENEESSNQFFKEKHKVIYQTQIQNPEALEGLSTKEFSRLLKYAIEEENFEVISTELVSRLAAGKLQVSDLYLLLFKSSDKAIQHQVYQYLEQNVQDAPSAIAIASQQEENWGSIEYLEQGDVSPFRAWVDIAIEDTVLTTIHPAEHARKQECRHHACLMWVKAYIEDALVSPNKRAASLRLSPTSNKTPPIETPMKQKTQRMPQIPSVLVKTLKDGQHFASMLNNLCQALRWDNPEYDFTETEEGFNSNAQIYALDERLTGAGIATKKQNAKNRAAKQILEQLQQKAPQEWGEWYAGSRQERQIA
jgi:ribonuclease R